MAGLSHLAKDLLEGWQHAYAAHEVQQVCVGQQRSLTCRERVGKVGSGEIHKIPRHLCCSSLAYATSWRSCSAQRTCTWHALHDALHRKTSSLAEQAAT